MASRNAALDNSKIHNNGATRSCLCSPTTHPGSFRCTLHRNTQRKVSNRSAVHQVQSSSPNRSESLKMIARANLLKAFLLQIIKPSKQNLRRRQNFQPKPTRFCLMNNSSSINNRYGVFVS
ncbi:hypothetical protein NE237_026992 [Protea cynaroides]|uniref:Uncharacterized protein n=1 Tax=Protea cynaroides TaxID=273540 RepID=A0A9Q0GMJ4_9MAGN|nr:hypothetical protein NE237_026992 [Protea cynaroides]